MYKTPHLHFQEWSAMTIDALDNEWGYWTDDEYYSLSECARRMGVSKAWLSWKLARLDYPRRKVGTAYVLRLEDVVRAVGKTPHKQ
jgi:hypothetical protein